MTPYELGLFVVDYVEKSKAKQEHDITIAYMIANWQRAKKMPSLKSVLGQEPKEKKQTPEAMLNEIMKLNAAFGGTTY